MTAVKVFFVLSLIAIPASAQSLLQTTCAVPGGGNQTATATVGSDVQATFTSITDACEFVSNAPLTLADCTAPTSFTIQWQLSNAAVATNGEFSVFAASEDNACPAYSTNDYYYRGSVSGVPAAVTTFPGQIPSQNGQALDTRAIMQAARCCDSAAAGSAACNGRMFNLCVMVSDKGKSPVVSVAAYMQFYVDTVAPSGVPAVTAAPGDARVKVSWGAEGSPVAQYHVTVYGADGSVVKTVDIPWNQPLEATLDGLNNDDNYTVTVAAVDFAGNAGSESAPQSFTPRNECDAWECYGGKEKGGFCFIATAAYGSYDHGTVRIFRAFRDRVLLKSEWGRAFVLAYYKHGVAPAIWLTQHPIARRAVAYLLWPIARVTAWVLP